MDVFAALTLDWHSIARRPLARRAMASWAKTAPALQCFASPAELVAAINQAGHPTRSHQLLSELLFLASEDPLAARAVLQAVTPGLRAVVHKRWPKTGGSGPWRSEHELAADSVAAGWEAVHVHGGQLHHRPAAIIIRRVESSLRQAQRRWTRHAASTPDLPDHPIEPSQSALDAAFSIDEQVARLIAEAVRSGVINPIEALLVTAVGLLGHTVTETERHLGMAPGSARHRLRHARQALRTWIGTPPVLDCFASSIEFSLAALPEPHRCPVSRPAQQLQLLRDERPSTYHDVGGGQTVRTGASR